MPGKRRQQRRFPVGSKSEGGRSDGDERTMDLVTETGLKTTGGEPLGKSSTYSDRSLFFPIVGTLTQQQLSSSKVAAAENGADKLSNGVEALQIIDFFF